MRDDEDPTLAAPDAVSGGLEESAQADAEDSHLPEAESQYTHVPEWVSEFRRLYVEPKSRTEVREKSWRPQFRLGRSGSAGQSSGTDAEPRTAAASGSVPAEGPSFPRDDRQPTSTADPAWASAAAGSRNGEPAHPGSGGDDELAAGEPARLAAPRTLAELAAEADAEALGRPLGLAAETEAPAVDGGPLEVVARGGDSDEWPPLRVPADAVDEVASEPGDPAVSSDDRPRGATTSVLDVHAVDAPLGATQVEDVDVEEPVPPVDSSVVEESVVVAPEPPAVDGGPLEVVARGGDSDEWPPLRVPADAVDEVASEPGDPAVSSDDRPRGATTSVLDVHAVDAPLGATQVEDVDVEEPVPPVDSSVVEESVVVAPEPPAVDGGPLEVVARGGDSDEWPPLRVPADAVDEVASEPGDPAVSSDDRPRGATTSVLDVHAVDAPLGATQVEDLDVEEPVPPVDSSVVEESVVVAPEPPAVDGGPLEVVARGGDSDEWPPLRVPADAVDEVASEPGDPAVSSDDRPRGATTSVLDVHAVDAPLGATQVEDLDVEEPVPPVDSSVVEESVVVAPEAPAAATVDGEVVDVPVGVTQVEDVGVVEAVLPVEAVHDSGAEDVGVVEAVLPVEAVHDSGAEDVGVVEAVLPVEAVHDSGAEDVELVASDARVEHLWPRVDEGASVAPVVPDGPWSTSIYPVAEAVEDLGPVPGVIAAPEPPADRPWEPEPPTTVDAPAAAPAGEDTSADEAAAHTDSAAEPVAEQPVAEQPVAEEPAVRAPVIPVRERWTAPLPAQWTPPDPGRHSYLDEIVPPIDQMGWGDASDGSLTRPPRRRRPTTPVEIEDDALDEPQSRAETRAAVREAEAEHRGKRRRVLVVVGMILLVVAVAAAWWMTRSIGPVAAFWPGSSSGSVAESVTTSHDIPLARPS